jgi:hypothetical protein
MPTITYRSVRIFALWNQLKPSRVRMTLPRAVGLSGIHNPICQESLMNVDNRLSRTLLLLPALFVFAACGGGGTHLTGTGTGSAGSQAGTAGAGTAGVGSGTGGATGTAGVGTGTAGSMTTGTGGTGIVSNGAVCMGYCTKIMANCTGPNQQYTDMASCMAACKFMPGGTPTDDGVNSASCRLNAATAAAMDTATVKSKCFAAGPLSYGICGEDCDVFCAAATGYCGASAGYASQADCMGTCSQFKRVLPGTTAAAPGMYNSMYTPGPAPDGKDTLECRAFYLFIDALQSPAMQTASCPNVANKSTICGPGVMPPMIDTDGGGGDAEVVKYDGGNVINSSNWNETLFPPTKRKMLLRDEGDPHMVMIDLSKTPILQWKTVAEGPWARASQLIGGNQILGGTSNGYQVWDYTTGMITKTVNGFGNTQSAYRMATGETMLTQSGTVLTFLDKTDKKSHQISYPGYGYVRVARPTRNGTFLVPSDSQLFEGDATGKVLWHTSGAGWSHIWMPLLLGPPVGAGKWKNGDTLLCTAFGSSCDVVDQTTHMVTFRFGGKQMTNAAMIKPNFFSEYEILPNGNIFTANWQGHGGGNGGSGIQVLEFDPSGTVVWFWKQDPTIFSSIQGVQSMDGKDPMKLHVQETSTDSTWQPVTSTP